MNGTFVCLGNARQQFPRLLEAIVQVIDFLPKPVLVQHGHTPFNKKDCQTIAFMDMEKFMRAVSRADLLIMHAGAGSVIHSILAGKTPIIMPRRRSLNEHIDDHQLDFAKVLVESGKAVLAETPEELIRAIKEVRAKSELNPVLQEPGMVKMIKDELKKLSIKIDGTK